MNGHVRQRGKGGQWYAVIDVPDPATGRRRRKWHRLPGCNGRRQAQLACAELIAELQRGTYLEPNKTTVAQFLHVWLDHVRGQVAPRTFERYAEICCKNIIPLIGGLALNKLRPSTISSALVNTPANGQRRPQRGLSPRTIVTYLRCLETP